MGHHLGEISVRYIIPGDTKHFCTARTHTYIDGRMPRPANVLHRARDVSRGLKAAHGRSSGDKYGRPTCTRPVAQQTGISTAPRKVRVRQDTPAASAQPSKIWPAFANRCACARAAPQSPGRPPTALCRGQHGPKRPRLFFLTVPFNHKMRKNAENGRERSSLPLSARTKTIGVRLGASKEGHRRRHSLPRGGL